MISAEFLQQYFHADYRGADSIIQEVLEPIFGNAELNDQSIISTATDRTKAMAVNIKDARHIATLWPLGSDESIKVFDITIEDRCHIHVARQGIQHLVREWVDRFEGAFMIFHYANTKGRSWRLSYMEKRSKNADSTSAKRYTYLCGELYPCRTIAERFSKLSPDNINATILEEAFSAEALSDEFFVEYKNFYDDFVSYVLQDDAMFARFKQYAKGNEDQAKKSVRDYIKKLMGRLVFIQFLQKKAWLNNDLHYMLSLFNESSEKQRADYLDNVLEPLFFGIFNTKPEDRAKLFSENKWDKALLEKWKEFPYLNGGLFECDPLDELRLPIPSYFFSNPEHKDHIRKPTDEYYEDACGIFDFFERYNFTIDESDPLDLEVGVDPEMLGKIFENLLEDNKDKGAFYTPKEIVQYMCKESLIAYLISESKKKNEASKQSQANFEEAIRAFVNDPEMTVTRIGRYTEKQLNDLLKSLQTVKICDPAIGSGAFPMGLLNLLVNCREALNKALGLGVPPYVLKHDIILNNIYGVDIEKGAIDIARLRFWLSIVVDLDSPQALPNFDYKFMQGNSLLEQYGGIDLSNLFNTTSTSGKGKGTEMLVFDESNITEALLQEKLRTYFSLKQGTDKQRVRQEVNDAVKDFILSKVNSTSLVSEIKSMDVSANEKFFLWHTWFKPVFDQGGFDIVIGNPPYINIANLKDDKLRKHYQQNFKTVKNKSDLYSIFTEQAFHLLKPLGSCSFIFSNSWMGTDSFSLFRSFLVNETKIMKIVDLPDKVFANATVKTCIILFAKESVTKNDINIEIYDGKVFKPMAHSLSYDYIKQYNNLPFTLEKNISLSHVPTVPLDSIAEFTLGIKTSNDKRFINTEPFKQDSYQLIRGRKVQRYNTPISEEWIWYRPDLFMEKVGAGPRRLEYFTIAPKIIIQDIALEICATIDKNKYLCNDTLNVIYEVDSDYSMNYILGLLNSKAVRFWHKKVFPEGLHIKIYQLKEIPIPTISIKQQAPIISLVDRILAAKKADPAADTSDLENQIDELAYNLYGLTEEEKEIIRKS